MVGNAEFFFKLRVYIEDTDAGGIVYYVNYLKYMERCRTEMMRSLGYDKGSIFNRDLMFVVRDVAIQYLKPARLDDELMVSASVLSVRGAAMSLRQSVVRADEVMAQGELKIACVDSAGLRPRRIPKIMAQELREAHWESGEMLWNNN
ncbi:MAG: tol-pal system-associated acyl-CoA thioesterase [Halieaceae bacterium]|jgi:tol-pal system-associated acyl-CoA thioesterase|nr:tol-pal system-associated acyl-CoA thioesterase [Halieaceae bacterium]